MKKPKRIITPVAPNLGLANYDWFIPIEDILAGIKKWKRGERPSK